MEGVENPPHVLFVLPHAETTDGHAIPVPQIQEGPYLLQTEIFEDISLEDREEGLTPADSLRVQEAEAVPTALQPCQTIQQASTPCAGT